MNVPNAAVGFDSSLAKLLEERSSGKPAPGIPSRLPAKDIRFATGAFQPRVTAKANREDHIKELQKHIENGAKMPPLLVWWSGKTWYVIDGHHRLWATVKALNEANKDKVDAYVDVTVLDGDVYAAIAAANTANSKDKLVMNKEDKLEAAWRMTLTGQYTIPEIVDATTIKKSTIINMRKAIKAVSAMQDDWDNGLNPSMYTWRQTRMLQNGQKIVEVSDTAEERAAVMMAVNVTRAVGSQQIIANPERFARAVELISDRLPPAMQDYWQGDEDLDDEDQA